MLEAGELTNILYVASAIPYPSPCGGTTHVHEVTFNLKALGHTVVLVTNRMNDWPDETIDGVPIYRFHSRLIEIPILKLAPIFKQALTLCRLCDKHAIDIILERESSRGIGALASKFKHLPLVEEINDPEYNKLSLHVAKRLTATSMTIIPEQYREKTVIFPYAANTQHIKPMAPSRIRKRFGLADTIVVGYLGSFYPWHGLGDLLEAAAMVIEQTGAKFLLVGDVKIGSGSDYKEQLEKIVKDMQLEESIIFAGKVPYSEVPEYYAAFDVCVAPYTTGTKEELQAFGFFYSPLKLFEYLAAGKPVVTTDIGNIKTIVTADTGVLVPEAQPERLAQAIIDLISDPERRQRLGEKGRKFACEHSWYNHVKEVERILLEARKEA